MRIQKDLLHQVRRLNVDSTNLRSTTLADNLVTVIIFVRLSLNRFTARCNLDWAGCAHASQLLITVWYHPLHVNS